MKTISEVRRGIALVVIHNEAILEMKDSKRRIYLRLIDIEYLEKSDEELLINVKNSVEEITGIEWLKEPSFHIKGGYIITGNIANELDLDFLQVKLEKAGFMAVI